MIYSSGINDLMREIGANTFSIKKSYHQKYKKPNYFYTLERAKTLKQVISSIDKNYDSILKINPKIDIYTLGAYIPKSLQDNRMDIFRELVLTYNEELSNLCKTYGITFINPEKIGEKYNHNNFDFHISFEGNNALANHILSAIYQNKFSKAKILNQITMPFLGTNNGIEGILRSLLLDYEFHLLRAKELSGYESKRELDIANEHKREIEIFEKVLRK